MENNYQLYIDTESTSGDHRYSLTPIGGELIEPVLTGGFYNIMRSS